MNLFTNCSFSTILALFFLMLCCFKEYKKEKKSKENCFEGCLENRITRIKVFPFTQSRFCCQKNKQKKSFFRIFPNFLAILIYLYYFCADFVVYENHIATDYQVDEKQITKILEGKMREYKETQ